MSAEHPAPLLALRLKPALALGWAAALLAAALDWPAAAPGLAAGLAAAALLAWWRPAWAPTLVLALLPVLDLTPWAGRVEWVEYDLFCATILGLAHLRLGPAAPVPKQTAAAGRLAGLAVGAVVTLLLLSATLAWLAAGDQAGLHPTALSPAAGLRLAKGAVWGTLLLALMARLRRRGEDMLLVTAVGMTAGLAALVAAVAWERLAFVGLLDFSTRYRVTGPLHAMGFGGAYLECCLVLGSCFAAWLAWRAPARGLRIAAALVWLSAGYALAVTYSRAGYAAHAVATALLLCGLLVEGARHHRIAAAGLIATAALLAAPVIDGSFARHRLQSIGKDLQARMAHWDGVSKPAASHSAWWGAGLGRYPAERRAHAADDARTAAVSLVRRAGGAAVLRLEPGDTLFVEQLVEARPHTPYRVEVLARAGRPEAMFFVGLCEKWLLASFECEKRTLRFQGVSAPAMARTPVPATDGGAPWTRFTLELDSGLVGAATGPVPRPLKFTLYTPHGPHAVDVASVHMTSPGGAALLRNGDFSRGLDHWHVTGSVLGNWHAQNIALAVRFELGRAGTLLLGALLTLALARAAGTARAGRAEGWLHLACLSTWGVLGVTDSLIDTPRLLMLGIVLTGWAALPSSGRLGDADGTRRFTRTAGQHPGRGHDDEGHDRRVEA